MALVGTRRDVTDTDLDATRIEPTGAETHASAPVDPLEDEWSLPRGAQIDRYLIVDRLGVGGMGEVFSAYDPELDRRVALKLVRFDAHEDPTKARGRLLREAQALAKLSHPNVVAVYDAGTHGDRVFITMEHVEGHTFRDWLRDAEQRGSPDAWREALELLLQAGAGLAAAHAQGMVHRDFKPANVMVSDDGRVRVLDFGLARRFGESEPSEETGPSAHDEPLDPLDSLNSSRSSLAVQLTQTGMVMGTPAYMAPEQFFGGYVDARTDQFSFCVVLYRGLFGIRPFAGETFAELGRAVARGQIREIPKSTRVPRAIQAALRRGLSVSRDDRYPTMDALLSDLERGVGQARRRMLRVAGVVTAAVGLTAAAVLGSTATESHTPCQGFESKLAGIWDDERREALTAAFAATELAYAEDARTAVLRSLDEYATTWTRLRTEVCEATQIRRDQSETLMDLRISCLDDRLHDVEALTTVLTEEVDADVVKNSVLGVGQLPELDECVTLERDDSGLLRPDDPDAVAEVEHARELTAAARARALAGKYQDALPRAEAALAAAEQTGFTPVIAEAHGLMGQVHDRSVNVEQARAHYEQALYAASESGHQRVQIQALTGLASVMGMHLVKTEEALHFARLAEAIAHHVGDTPQYSGAVALYRGNALMAANRFDEALAQARHAVEVTRGDAQAERIHLAALNNVAAILGQMGRYKDAAAALEDALAAAESRLGPWHPTVGSTLNNLGVTYSRLGEPELAMKHMKRAIEIYEKVLGPDHPDLGRGYHNLGVAYSDQGDDQRAYDSYHKALEHKQRTLGPDHVSVAFSANNVGDALLRLDRADEAIPFIEDALRIWKTALGPDNPNNIYGLVSLAQAHLALDHAELALPLVRRALELAQIGNIDPVEQAKAEFVAARATLRASDDREGALDLARRARAGYQASDRPSPVELAEIDSWLANPK